MNTPEHELLKVREVAKMMRISKTSVYRLIHTKQLPAVRPGHNFRVHITAVTAYLQASKEGDT